MTARMVATTRKYTRQQKADYRARVRRRHLNGHAHRLPLRLDWDGFRRAADNATKTLRSLSRNIGVDPDVMQRLAEQNARLMQQARQQLGIEPARTYPDDLPTAEELLGMVRERGGTLDEILDLPPLPSDLTWADFSGMFASEHQADAHTLPEGWTQT